MATPTEHAVCSASASERWSHCTAAPRFEEQFPSSTSEYAAEGTLAHSFCELAARKKFTDMSPQKYGAAVRQLKKDPLYNDEMLNTADFYVQYLSEKAMTFDTPPHVVQEVKVDFSDYVPQGFGTCDCVMIGGDTLHITDYKHGKGVAVSAKDNSQMRLYALGALKRYAILYGDSIKKVSMAICQPRITENVSEDVLTVEELKAWGEYIKPIAMKAYTGMGDFVPGDWCRFCRGKAQCRARAEVNTVFEEFKGCLIEGRMTEADAVSYEQADCLGADVPPILSDIEIADLLNRAKDLLAWYKDLQEYALSALLAGKELPGWKLVEGRSDREFTDADAALDTIKNAGYDEAVLFERKPLSLAKLEKLLGKAKFAETVGEFVRKPQGKATLVPESDKRPVFSPAAADFKDVATSGNV